MKLRKFLRSSFVWLACSVMLLVVFFVFSKLTSLGYFQRIDFDITVRLQDKVPARFDSYWEDIAFLASPVVSVVWGIMLMVIGLVKFKRWKKLAIILIPLGLAMIVGAEIYGKTVVEQTPPPFFMLKNPTAHFPTYHEFAVNSYPSGHAARVLFLSIISYSLIHRFIRDKKLRRISMAGLSGLVILVSIGKVYLGQHWASDVVGGMLVASAMGCAWIGLLLYRRTSFARASSGSNSPSSS